MRALKLRILAVIALALVPIGTSVRAQETSTVAPPASSTTVSTDERTSTRISQLEEQIKALQSQIDALKAVVERAARPEPEVHSASSAAVKVAAAPKAAVEKQAKAESMPQQTQRGVDIGSARLTPYGTIFFNAFGNSAGTNNTDVPLFATPTGSSNASATVRQTRLGMRLDGAKAGAARLSAIIEADFFGGFPSVGIGENFGVIRLRLANARLDWEKTSLTIGQDWMVFAPVSPTSLAAAAIPQMAAAGNPWARLPQVKIDRKLHNNVNWAVAVAAPQTGDSATNAAFFLQPTTGANSRIPFLQSRIAISDNDWLNTKKSGSVGLSGHYGRSRVFTGITNIENDIDSAGIALDWNFPLAKRINILGEAFWGRNLGGFQAGIFQGFNNDHPSGVRAIETRGGWIQVGFTPDVLQDKLSINASMGIDDPRNSDLVTLSRREFRSQNISFAVNSIYKFSPQFSISGEFRRFQTLYLFTGRRNANHINLAAAYSF